ncbi:MAG: nuclear transport factor 2 family protein [Bacteroidota bacterium]
MKKILLTRIKYFSLIILLLPLPACSPSKISQIEQRMNYYDHLILKTDADSISQMYTSDGELGNAVRGRDSIKLFLSRFKSFKVKLQKSVSQSITFLGDTAIQKGTYHQITNVPNRGDVEIKGTFTAKWVKEKSGIWLLKRMETKLF